MKTKNTGSIYVISTPIGNIEDITIRAIKTLDEMDFIACEDTRITSKLCRIHKINYKDKLISYHDHNSSRTTPFILKKLNDGFNIGLVSDAGTPLISDPGYKLIRSALEKNIEVKSIPGPSALTAAMSVSGISSDQFIFIGFLPRKKALRRIKISSLVKQNYSVIMFENALRLNKLLEELHELLGNRNISIIREITKLYEENIRGSIRDVMSLLKNKNIKGEIVVLIEKPETPVDIFKDQDIINMLKKKLPKLGASRASKEISKITSIKSDYIYKLAISLKE
ncbi:MAG: 16S rRNA (cytidine(1402)-2'-O)-methyltransferase [Pelagibacterales bacterium]|nr:16S rRNA (cytidine(1402)-2'-O)-methyltransferase [Pelagibacterales bacterium]PPR16663.1 MAG: Ribosomal RNA small subunit methyltransferase I [Alphaproteobacteria bacterium MarineAlpha9_Bin3]|tara:strand:+ start:8350 stop:9195 length:846 start_codon:yes stop_codon:yes gene_type:complete